MLEAAVFGAYFNVMINLKDIADDEFKRVVSRVAWASLAMRLKGRRWWRQPGTPRVPLRLAGRVQCMVGGSSGLPSGK